MLKKIVGVCVLTLICFSAFSQKVIRGFVIDSASFAPLPYVNIRIKHTNFGTSTDAKGAFQLTVRKTDSLVFSLVGYNEEHFAIAELEETVLIRMAVHINELEGVTITAKKEKFIKPIRIRAGQDSPNFTQGINFAYFSKLEKEKRKLGRVKEEWERVKSYVAVVCSPEVKERICLEYKLTDDQYFQILAEFNIQNKNNDYSLTSEEWITVLREFYASRAQR